MCRGLGGNSCEGRSVQVEGSVSVHLSQASGTGRCSEAGALWVVGPWGR